MALQAAEQPTCFWQFLAVVTLEAPIAVLEDRPPATDGVIVSWIRARDVSTPVIGHGRVSTGSDYSLSICALGGQSICSTWFDKVF